VRTLGKDIKSMTVSLDEIIREFKRCDNCGGSVRWVGKIPDKGKMRLTGECVGCKAFFLAENGFTKTGRQIQDE
jgi:hypothetical protein